MPQKIVIIGNGPAGLTAASTARLTDRTAEITVVDSKKYDTYHPCALPFVIGRYLPSIETIIEDLNFERMNITLLLNTVADAIDRKKKVVTVVNNDDGSKSTLPYDKLILCTGSNVFVPPIPGRDLKNVFRLKFAEDAQAIKEVVSAESIKNVIVVGGSAIGIEVATEVRHLGKEVTIVEMFPQLMPLKISKDIALLAQKRLEETGIIVRTGMMVKEILGTEKVEHITIGTEDKLETLAADVVVLATGVRPNAQLAQKSGLKLVENFKAIEVNEKMQTSDEAIYAAGDCVSVTNLVTKERSLVLLAGPAVRQGRIAGINAAGGDTRYPGSVNSFIVSSRNFYVGVAGINTEQAKKQGIETTQAKITAPIRPHYMPTTKPITIKLIARSSDGKLLGGEVFGEEKVDENVNYIAFALQTGLTVYDLLTLDFCYAPAVSETIYPIVIAADAIVRKIERKKARAAKSA
ncbi:hypothetical protein DRO91_00545 [Candidatus Heimdallarchaeota archaeon]|nr:MAG: hypothetical protein DRP02_00985 [Candidatus Gerdarchaeota archaeon]RLI74417.1 MAG: hypothetical protein DRO91_00545 [Candidatus Heimdallarchaeota archaeon]